MTKKLHTLPLVVGDYLADTYELNEGQHGCYFLLLMLAWQTPGCRIADDLDHIHRFMRAKANGMHRRTFNAIVPDLLQRFWQKIDGFWYSKKLSKVREKVLKKSSNGAENVAKRWPKSSENVVKTPHESIKNNGVDYSNPIQDNVDYGTDKLKSKDISYKEEEKEKEKKEKEKFSLPDWVPAETWREFVKHRERLRAPMTDDAKRRMVLELARLSAKGDDPGEVLGQSIVRGWKGVFPLKETNKKVGKSDDKKFGAEFENQDFRAGSDGFNVT